MNEKVRERMTVRGAARRQQPLSGTDAQALEGALSQVELDLAEKGREIARLRKNLDEYGEHRRGCAKVFRSDTGACSCGLDAALEDEG